MKARVRRNVVLDRLAELGWVPQERIDKAKASPLGLAPDAGSLKLRQPPFFVHYITDQIIANVDGEYDAFGKTENARAEALYEGGLKITTTLDPDWQAAAQAVANEPYRESVANPNYAQTPRHRHRVRRQHDRRHPHDALGSQLPEGPVEPGRRAAVSRAPRSSRSPWSPRSEMGSRPARCSRPSRRSTSRNGRGTTARACRTPKAPATPATRTCGAPPQDSINVVFAQLILEVGPDKVVRGGARHGRSSRICPRCRR